MKDGQIVWQAQCAHCGWKDPEYVRDIATGEAHAAEHLHTVHGMVYCPFPDERQAPDAPQD